MSAAPKIYLQPHEYLQSERSSEERHEYYAGKIYPKIGSNSRHNRIVGRTLIACMQLLDNTDFEPFALDMRTKVDYGYKYPDVVIACNPHFEDDEMDTLTNAVVIIEALSSSTERYDRTTKFDRYRTIPTLREYVLIAQAQPRIERFSRIDNPNVAPEQTLWAYQAWSGLESRITLDSVDCTLEAAEMYQNIEFDETEADSPFDLRRKVS